MQLLELSGYVTNDALRRGLAVSIVMELAGWRYARFHLKLNSSTNPPIKITGSPVIPINLPEDWNVTGNRDLLTNIITN